VDHATNSGPGQKKIQDPIPQGPYRAAPSFSGLELPETGEACSPKKRRRHPELETPSLGQGKKNAARLGAHIAFADESGFQLIPSVRRTWSPRGQTPIIRYLYKHDRISAISAVTVSPGRQRLGLYFQLHQKNIRRPEVCQFLRHLLKHLRGHVIVILDNGRPHSGEDIRKLCKKIPRLHLEYFPAYAPELNPDEGIWSQAKHALANGRPEKLDALSVVLTKTLLHLKNSPAKLRWCIHQSDLPPFLTK